jgi:hypothetical protein
MLAGVDESSFRRWRQCLDPRGFHGATKNDKRCWNCTGCALHQKTQQAELRCKQSCLTTILKAGEVKWQACAWFLERRYPTEYALRRVIDVSSQDARPNPYDNVRELLLGAGIITEETAVGIEEGIKEKPSTTPSVVTN